MHTAIAVSCGLIYLVLVLALGRQAGWTRRTITIAFLASWLVATVIHGAIGIDQGQTPATELAVGLVIFGVPALGLLWARQRLAWASGG